jgi:hypothetical protein
MKRSLRIVGQLAGTCLLALLIQPWARSQSIGEVSASPDSLAILQSVRVLSEGNEPALEIITSRPLIPSISRVDSPPRLVIDLPNARLSKNNKNISLRGREIKGVRISRFKDSPPMARIVVDLVQPVAYTWDAAGNRLTVRLRPSQEAARASSVSASTPVAPPAAVPVTSSPSGAVVLAGSRVTAGSSVTAGADTAVLRLGRGGEVRVCPGTTVSVTPSQSGRSLMLGMNTGAVEAHYSLGASSDSIVTPDFRILLAGPGEFHFGFSSDPRGNTCVQALPGNTASVIVSELLGDGTYQVKPSEQVIFRAGQLNAVDSAMPMNCGCPAPAPAIMRASAAPAAEGAEARPSSTVPLGRLAASSETAALPPSKASDVHVQVEAPLVFRADDRLNQPPPAQPAPTQEAGLLPVRDLSHPTWWQPVALPPPKVHHGVLGKIRSFFAAIFG